VSPWFNNCTTDQYIILANFLKVSKNSRGLADKTDGCKKLEKAILLPVGVLDLSYFHAYNPRYSEVVSVVSPDREGDGGRDQLVEVSTGKQR